MPSIDISLAKDPFQRCFAFAPGEKMRIEVKFEDQVPERYRLKILDQRNNSRLNRYGKGSEDGIILEWPIPPTLKIEHLGIWHIQIEDYRNDQLLLRSFFFVEQQQRIEAPMLPSGPAILGLSERWVVTPAIETEEIPVTYEEPIRITSEDEAISDIAVSYGTEAARSERMMAEQDLISQTPVIAIKGLGKTYANRLDKIKVYTVNQFFHYTDRVALAEIMRVSDTKLEKMLNEAELLIKQEVSKPSVSPDRIVTVGPPLGVDLLELPGIGIKSVEKLAKLGIKSRSDLIDYEDVETLRKTLRMSQTRLTKLFSSIGRTIPILEKIELKPKDPFKQPVISIKGIGAKTADKLKLRGILTVKDLLDSSFSSLKTVTGEKTYLKWKQNAEIFTGQKSELVTSPFEPTITSIDDLIRIPGIGPRSVAKLANLGVKSVFDLINFEDVEKLRKTLRMSLPRLQNLITSLEKSIEK
ncbi:MAG: helix-hairpin-helix domain-containing protein [Candidatus Hodarchaeota archaeon]